VVVIRPRDRDLRRVVVVIRAVADQNAVQLVITSANDHHSAA
jgi:hypothetical protein